MKKFDYAVIGAGIVGSSIAWKLMEKNPSLKVALIEKESEPGQHQTSHNSGVIHSGIYYKPGTFKARFCRKGYDDLLAFCRKNEIPFQLTGKLIVASQESELKQLEILYQRGMENNLEGVRMVNGAEVKEVEPHCTAIKAIYLPQTGIISFPVVLKKYIELFQQRGGEVFLGHKVEGFEKKSHGTTILTNQNSIFAKTTVTAGGLYSDKLVTQETGDNNTRILPFRGEYYKLRPEKSYLVKGLIYPVPNPAFPFLGVHFTRMIGGEVEAGPNAVLAFRREGYKKTDFSLNESLETLMWPGFQKIALKYWQVGMYEMYRSLSKAKFLKDLQKLIPELAIDDLVDGGTGVRAQASSRAGLIDDFDLVETPTSLHVRNAPSPAATSSIAIADHVVRLLEARR